jgi:hypothetical protein
MRDVSKVCKSTRRTKDKANPCPLKEEEDRCKDHHHVDSSKLSRVSTQVYSGEASRVDKKKLMLGVHGQKMVSWVRDVSTSLQNPEGQMKKPFHCVL